MWIPAVTCSTCGRPNDFDFNFCCKCGTPPRRRRLLGPRDAAAVQRVAAETEHIRVRWEEIAAMTASRKWVTAVDAEVTRFEKFLAEHEPPKVMEEALPRDVVNFYLVREISGGQRTQFHRPECLFWGTGDFRGKPQACGCRMGMPRTTYVTNWGKLSSHFRTVLGRTTDWSPLTSTGNPCLSEEVRHHGEVLQREMEIAAVVTEKAVPVFSDKLAAVLEHLHGIVLMNPRTSVPAFAAAQDAAFLALLWSSGVRGGNLAPLREQQLWSLPGGSGILLHLFRHKTSVKEKKAKRMIAAAHPNVWLDPVRRLRAFLTIRKRVADAGAMPAEDFVFRRIVGGRITAEPFDIGSLNGRLVGYLRTLGLFVAGETVHGLRAAERIEAVLGDGDLQNILRNNDWASANVRDGYLDLCETVSLLYSKDASFRALSKDERIGAFRRLAAGDLERFQ